MQLITVDSDGNIISSRNVYDTGGSVDAIGATLLNGYGMYVRVYSHGLNDYDPNNFYVLNFDKFN